MFDRDVAECVPPVVAVVKVPYGRNFTRRCKNKSELLCSENDQGSGMICRQSATSLSVACADDVYNEVYDVVFIGSSTQMLPYTGQTVLDVPRGHLQPRCIMFDAEQIHFSIVQFCLRIAL